MFNDGCSTDTSRAQQALEVRVARLYQELLSLDPQERPQALTLCRDSVVRYLHGGLGQLPAGFASLDASKPWICYWITHSLALLGAELPPSISQQDVIAFLSSCQHPAGGYGGGVGQLAHLAPTYAAVCSLATLGTPAAFNSIQQQQLHAFLRRMAIPAARGGGFTMHEGGEADLRACFTAMAVASMTGADLAALAAAADMVNYIKACQTYEGGLGGEPGNEAHGGYTFCGVAALLLLGRPEVLDVPLLLHWATQRQGHVEGGFNGRTNKLVDGCYSFWQGGVFPLLQRLGPEHLRQTRQVYASLAQPLPPQEGACDPQQQQQQQQEEEQQELVVVPDLPDLSRVRSPLQQALAAAAALRDDLEECTAAAEQAAAEADPDTWVSEAAAAGPSGQHGEGPRPGAMARVSALMERVREARQALEEAEQQVDVAQAAAVELLPPWPSETGAEGAGDQSRTPATAGSEAVPGALEPGSNNNSSSSGASAAVGPEGGLFHSAALQLWVLKACQTMTGLRDKPGKPPDYYHTCYCLSGLSAAQHAEGGAALGDSDNLLVKADPLVNVVEGQLAAMRAFFKGSPL